jgi:regulator of ribonuclease activity A
MENLGGRPAFHGHARTARCIEDNGILKTLMHEAGHGAVLVVDGGGLLTCTLLGGNMAQKFADNGWSGVHHHGAIRDRHELAGLPLGVQAVGSNPSRSLKNGIGTVDCSVVIGGVTIAPGNYVWADDDGILVGDS